MPDQTTGHDCVDAGCYEFLHDAPAGGVGVPTQPQEQERSDELHALRIMIRDDESWQTIANWARSRLNLDGISPKVAAISQWIDDSYAPDVHPELAMRRRTGKVGVEYGEMQDAIEGWTGENPRKGSYATKDDVLKELLDVASAALCAYEHLTGNNGTAVAALNEKINRVFERAGLGTDRG
jgi:hypothetical protein